VRVEKRSADFVVEFLNANPSSQGAPGRGSCYIQRSLGKGSYILQARILLEDDPSCFLDFYPSGSGTRADVVMYGAIVKKGLYISDMIYRILLLSFSDIVDATSHSFDWSLVFKFGGKGPDYIADIRSAAAQSAQQEGSAGSSMALVPRLPGQPGKVSLASAPSFASPGSADVPKGPRSARIAASADRAANFESIVLDLGDTGAREIALSPDAASALISSDDGISKPNYVDFPRYDAKGIPLEGLRAALYLDLISNPDSVYALAGDALRATAVPYFDDAGRLNFTFFSGGKEMSWEDLSAGKKDSKVRVLRVPS